ncbi:serine protease FAM111A-like isoform X2 [Paramisgurnus dabryanus]|uniref:serine protease FAM111A-like isoform X2 n=2 Tax=Paramisgurnus dabryanus TaxID=90735 RepID=UPI0031F433FF
MCCESKGLYFIMTLICVRLCFFLDLSDSFTTTTKDDNINCYLFCIVFQGKMDHSIQLQYSEGEIHVFQFRIGYKKYKVACTTSQTVLDALTKNGAFESHLKKHLNKEIIIQRSSKGKVPGAAVKTDFPCCLLENDEILDINFISNEGNISANQEVVEPSVDLSPLSQYKAFYIRTRGKIKKKIMKNNQMMLTVDYVCVYALKGETLETALQRDGRFSDEIFSSPCELMDIFKDASYELSLPVDSLSEHQFELHVKSQKAPALNTSPSAVNESKEVPADPPTAATGEQPINEIPKLPKKRIRKTEKATSSLTKVYKANISWSPGIFSEKKSSFLPFTEEILQAQIKRLLEKLNERENSQVKKLFEEEYGKSIKNFCEVSTMKELMKFSDSVCVIVADKKGIGTGFLLFDKFILTNAHVVQENLSPQRMPLFPFFAAFNFEHQFLKEKTECVPIKADLAAFRLEKDDKGKHHDYALLELDINQTPQSKYLQMLNCYNDIPPPNSGGIYIVGHPNCESKKIDFCFTIETENQLQAIHQHISENPFCPYVSWQCWPDLHENKITYNSCFFHGSSGSPVFDGNCSLIGMHTGGYAYKDNNGETRSVIEYCYSMQSILENIRETAKPYVKEALQEFERRKANIGVKQEPQQEDVNMESDESKES